MSGRLKAEKTDHRKNGKTSLEKILKKMKRRRAYLKQIL
jgi:hypothetical protein